MAAAHISNRSWAIEYYSDHPLLRRAIAVVVALLLVAYGAVVLWFLRNEEQLLFQPQRSVLPQSAELQPVTRNVEFPSTDGVLLQARVIEPPGSVSSPAAGWLLYLHGNTGNIGLPAYNKAWAKFRQLGLGVLAMDYRGYGHSAGKASEAGFYRDATAAYGYLRKVLGVPPRRILLYGFSLGGAVAIELATRVPAAGLLVEGAWLSVPHLGAERYPWLPVSWIVSNRFDSLSRIAAVRMPKLFLHARKDSVIPVSHSETLFRFAKTNKRLHRVAGDHATAHTMDASFFLEVAQFIEARGIPLASR